MAVANGFGKVVTSGSVFMYDTGDTVNSYRGEPTTNLYTTLGFSFYQAEGGHTALRTIGPAPLLNLQNNYDYHTITTDANWVSESKRLIIWPNNSLAASTSHYVSFWARVTNASTAQIGCAFYGSGINNTLNLTTEWQYFKFASTTHPNFRALEFGSKSGAIIFQIAGLQIELKSHATPYVNGTRSSTQGLLSLVGNSTIDLSSVSFDSNAQIIFDGTDDTIDTGIPLTDLPALSNFSIECIVKIDSYPSSTPPNGYGATYRCGVLVGATYYCGTALYWYGNSSGTICNIYAYTRGADAYRTAGEYNLTPGRYHHLILTNDYTNGSINLYANGILNGSAATATQEYNPGLTPDAGNIGISKAQVDGGGEAVYSNFLGQLPITKIYKRALSAAEVRQNYNKYKTRFNLP